MNRRNFIKKNLLTLGLMSLGGILLSSNIITPRNAMANTNFATKNNDDKIKVGILLFDNVEVLDFAGPFEVFSIPFKGEYTNKIFDVITVSEDGKLVNATNGLKVQPDYSIATMPDVDVMIIPGGGGTDKVAKNPLLLQWIKERASKVEIMASVCTGAFLLAQVGLLDGKEATTHIELLDQLENKYPACTVKRNVKFVDAGNVITAAGISAGIEMSFHLVKKLADLEAAKATAHIMEYDIVLD